MIDSAQFRRTLGNFASGVCIVTAVNDQTPVGFTCQSFSSLSLDPPLILFCPAKASTTWPEIRESGNFCVNVLAHDQMDYSNLFAGSAPDRFEGVSWEPATNGAPRLLGVVAYIDCRLDAVYDGGDHHIAVGRVLDLDVVDPEADPLLYFRAAYTTTHKQ
jgi:3-hydroxy-9,10-secoandrosta-1,3,5(10)-triene-9,17-dione monooxygenase reductase component